MPESPGDEVEPSEEAPEPSIEVDLAETVVEEEGDQIDIAAAPDQMDALDADPTVVVSESGTRRVPPGCRARGFNGISCVDADLRGYDFTGLQLGRFSSFWGANLSGARFDGASLQLATFFDANLTGASFEGADLARANFNKADLTKANFRAANLTSAWVTAAFAFEANFRSANLTGATFENSELARAIWTDGRVCSSSNSFGWCG
ncbi:MAG: pentapeptide repeat-containing protein [Candidatus Nanopelagicales bacterium]|nr:pentapeptide repeat-containing protein [Candidatus Nanopelagicales bacterium]